MKNRDLFKKFFLVLLWLTMLTPASFAQLSNTPGQALSQPMVNTGDALPAPAVPSGLNTTSTTTSFSTKPEQIPFTIYLRTNTYSHNTHQYMGRRIVWTIRPATLNTMQLDLIGGILQFNLSTIQTNSEHAVCVDVSEDQLKQIQSVLITEHHHTMSSSWLFENLPIARVICHWAIVLGIVYATVMLTLAAYGLVMSHRGSADKIIGTVAGLMILLMAYAIYCLMVSNARGNRSNSINSAAGSTEIDTPVVSNSLPLLGGK